MTLMMLSPMGRVVFALWAFILCFAGIIRIICALRDRKYVEAFVAMVLFASAYIVRQVIYDIYVFDKTGNISTFVGKVGTCPLALWVMVLIIITAAIIELLLRNRRYSRENIMPSAIKRFVDHMPNGICYWNDNGRVILSNVCMNQLCVKITGAPLLNGDIFRKSVEDGVLTLGNKVWNVSSHDIMYNGKVLHEMIASDISEIYLKTLELKNNNEELSVLTDELREFSQAIDEAVRKEEILRAKVNIHDEMNRLMLTTDATDLEDVEALDTVFSMWERNALLLCMESEGELLDDAVEKMNELAKALGITLTWEAMHIDEMSEMQKELLFTAGREALANAAKHASAKNMLIATEKKEAGVSCRFANDGEMPNGEIVFSGGLSNLARMAKQQNADLYVFVDDGRCVLSIDFEE